MKIQLELNSPEPIVVKAFIPPITFATAGFHLDWEPLATLREVEPQRDYSPSTFQGFLPRKAVSVGEHWKVDSESALQLLKQLAEEPQLELMELMEGGSGHPFALTTTIMRRLCSAYIRCSRSRMGGLHPHNLLEP